MKSKNERWFVAVYENGEPVRIYEWDVWLRIDIQSRDLDNCMVIAKDELEAFNKAKNRGGKDWIEWMEGGVII